MARKNGKDADRIVRDTPIPAKGNTRVPILGERSERGLNALITAAGWRGFVLRYRLHGRERYYTIGGYPDWSTARAKVRAGELRGLIDRGIDPHDEDAKARDEAITLAEFWQRVYEPLHVSAKRPRYARDIRGMMANDVLPQLGKRLIKDVDGADVAALHRKITRRAPFRANRMLATLNNLMSWAERPHIAHDGERIPALRPRHSNPCSGIARNHEEPRQRFLKPAELAQLAEVLDGHPERTTVALVRFLLLTGARFSEAASARWDQIDLDTGIWTKPSSHTKQKTEHVTYLSKPALALLQGLHERNGSSAYLFPGSTGQPITTIKTMWRSVTKQAGIEGVRVHDLRHSFASVLASGGASLLLIGQLLGHTQAATTRRYSHLVDSVQREAVERAGAVIAGNGAQSAELVPLRR